MESKMPHRPRADDAPRSPSPASWGGTIGLALAFFAATSSLADPVKGEARAQALFQEVRCVVCQSESIADSDAVIAADMRGDIRARIAAGESDVQIRQDLYARYGDYVLFRPRVSKANMLLWLIPPLIVLAGIATLVWLSRKQKKSKSYALSTEERKKLQDILNKRD